LLAASALQDIGAIGKSLEPIFTHLARSVLGKLQATGIGQPAHPSKGGERKWRIYWRFRKIYG
jgi:hypothetical protein